MLRAKLLCQRQLAARNLYGERHKVLCAIELKVVQLHGYRKFSDGIAQHERIFKLALLLRPVELAKLLVGVISLAVVQRCVQAVR